MKTLADAIEYARGANSKLEIHFYCASAIKIITVLLGAFGALNVASALVLDAILTIAALVSARELLKK
jgi:cation transport ATPase